MRPVAISLLMLAACLGPTDSESSASATGTPPTEPTEADTDDASPDGATDAEPGDDVEPPAACDDALEPNDTWRDAVHAPTEGTITGASPDFFEVEIPGNSVFSLDVDFDPTVANLDLVAYTADGDAIGGAGTLAAPETLSMVNTRPNPTTVLVEVAAPDAPDDTCLDYTVHTMSGCGLLADGGDDSTWGSPNLSRNGVRVQELVDDDVDWVSIALPPSTMVELAIHHDPTAGSLFFEHDIYGVGGYFTTSDASGVLTILLDNYTSEGSVRDIGLSIVGGSGCKVYQMVATEL